MNEVPAVGDKRAGSGFAVYDDAHDPKYGDPFDVPLKLATEKNLAKYGRIVRDYDAEEVWIEQWPKSEGWRPVCPGTGRGGGIVSGLFRYWWDGDLLKAENEAIGKVGRDFITGRLPQGVSPDNRTHVLVREANCHPDGGQVFYSKTQEPFVAVLAPPGDDVKMEDFEALYFDGTFGFQIKRSVWHQPLYPMGNTATFVGKQGAIYACCLVDTVDEFGKFMRVPIQKEFIKE